MSKPPKSPENLTEEVLHTELVFQGRFLKVTRDQVKTPDGIISHREYIKHPGAAVILPILADGSVLLLRQYRHALKKVFWEIPAGKRDAGEDPLKTAHRELQEETGYTTANMELLTLIHPVIGYADEEMHIYLATNLKVGPQKLDPGENLVVHAVPWSKTWELVEKGEISDVKTLIALFWFKNFKMKGSA